MKYLVAVVILLLLVASYSCLPQKESVITFDVGKDGLTISSDGSFNVSIFRDSNIVFELKSKRVFVPEFYLSDNYVIIVEAK